MRKKRVRFGIKFPEGEVEEIAFGSSTSSGAVLGVPHSSKHITLVDERKAVSSHGTEQDTKKHNHLGRVSKNEMNDRFWLEILKPRKMKKSELDQTMMYFTKKWDSLVNMPDDVCFKVTDDKSMSYLDLDAISKYEYSFFHDLQKSPDAYVGVCSVGKMLSVDDIECGLLENEKFVFRIDQDIYEMDLSSLREALLMQNSSVSENPLLNVLKMLGVSYLQESFMERFRELCLKSQSSTEK
jgi:hypothetical protein